jgi:transposase
MFSYFFQFEVLDPLRGRFIQRPAAGVQHSFPGSRHKANMEMAVFIMFWMPKMLSFLFLARGNSKGSSLIQRHSVICWMSFVTWKRALVVLCGDVKTKAAQPVRRAAFDRMACSYATPNVCKVG